MTELDRPHYQCLNFSSAFSAYRLQQSDRVFDICDVRDRHDRYDRQPRAQKILTTRIPRSLIHNNNGIQKYQAIIYCYHIQTFSACLVRWKECAESTTRILLLGCIESDRRKPSARHDDLQYRNISVKVTLTVKDGYVQRSFALGDLRSLKTLWSSWIRDGIMQFTGLYFAVLGGAYSSLAKANSRYARKASSLAKRQIRLAQLVNDPVQECKCWLYYAEDLIHLGKLMKAKRILEVQVQYAKDGQNGLLEKMCESVDHKLRVAQQSQKVERSQKLLTSRKEKVSI